MRLRVHRSGESLVQAISSGTDGHYATFGRAAIAPALLEEIETRAGGRGHVDVASVAALRSAADQALREFFALAARSDPEWRFAHSSRVLLGVADYPDLALLFLLRALAARAPDATVHVLVTDEWQAQLVDAIAGDSMVPAFHPAIGRSIARAARSFARSIIAPSATPSTDILFFTIGAQLARGEPDAYFGDLAQAVAARRPTLTVYASPGKRLRFPVRPDALPLEAFLKPADVAHAWRQSRRDAELGLSMTQGDAVLMRYLRAREQAAGEVSMQAVLAAGFERMLAQVRPRTLVYPFENRSWEKTLLNAARRHNVTRCIGYQHSSLTPRHLAFQGGQDDAGPLPDIILTCGEITAERIMTTLPRARVIPGAALRARRLNVGPPAPAGVLAPISSSRAEAWAILRALHGLAQLDAVPILVRTHPTIPIDDLYARFRWPGHVRLSRGRSLADDLSESAIVVYSSSTVALEGMLYGRTPVYLDIGDVPSGDPIGEHDFVFRASDAQSLAATLAQIRALPAPELERLRVQARAYAERYLVEPTPEHVARMAALIAQC